MRITAPDGRSVTAEYPPTGPGDGSRHAGLSIRRATLDALLLEAARRSGATCLEGCRVTDLIVEGGRVQGVRSVGSHGPANFRGRIIVGGDGRCSVVARRLDLHRLHPTHRRMALVAYQQGPSPLDRHGSIVIGERAYCILNPLADRVINVGIVLDQRAVQAHKGRVESLFEAALAGLPAASGLLGATRRMGPVRCLGPLAFRARRPSVPGAILIGDAAGFYDPLTGDGIAHALWSAELASRAIVAALSGRGLDLRPLVRFGLLQRRVLAARNVLRTLLQAAIARPPVANALAGWLRRHPSPAHLLLAVTGDLLPSHPFPRFDAPAQTPS
jgi:flavin-dependent dehydrogenase